MDTPIGRLGHKVPGHQRFKLEQEELTAIEGYLKIYTAVCDILGRVEPKYHKPLNAYARSYNRTKEAPSVDFYLKWCRTIERSEEPAQKHKISTQTASKQRVVEPSKSGLVALGRRLFRRIRLKFS